MKLALPLLAVVICAWPAIAQAQLRVCDHDAEQVCVTTTLTCIARSCDPQKTDVQSNVQCRARCYVDKGKCLRQAGCLE